PKILEPEAVDGVQESVGKEYLTVPPFALSKPHENEEQRQTDQRLVQLHGMQGHAQRSAANSSRVGVCEDDGPRHAGRAPVVVSRHQTTNPTDRLTERDGGRAEI